MLKVFDTSRSMLPRKINVVHYRWMNFLVNYVSCFLAPVHAFLGIEGLDFPAILITADSFALVLFLDHVRRAKQPSRDIESYVTLLGLSPMILVPIVQAASSNHTAIAYISILRLLRAPLLPKQFHAATFALAKNGVAVLNDMMEKILFTSLVALFFTSTSACIWFFLSCNDTGEVRDHCRIDDSGGSWISQDIQDGTLNINSSASRYFRSFHFVAQTLLTIGYGDIYPVSTTEICFSLFLMLSGAIFYAYIISAITALLSSRDITTKLFRNDLTSLRRYLKLRKVPEEDQRNSFVLYLEFLFSRQLGVTEENVLEALPDHVSKEIRTSLCMPQLKQVPFFSHQSDDFALHCAQRLRFITFGPGAVLRAKGAVCRAMYLVRTGKVDLISSVGHGPLFCPSCQATFSGILT